MSLQIKYLKLILSFIIILFPDLVLALESDEDQPAQILADSAVFMQKQGTAIYKGNVRVKQGTTQIWSEQLVVFTKENKIIKAIAYGNAEKPAVYRTMPSKDGEVFFAKAQVIQYLLKDKYIVLEGQAQLKQGANWLQGKKMTYDITTGLLVAPPVPGEHIEMFLQPNSPPTIGQTMQKTQKE